MEVSHLFNSADFLRQALLMLPAILFGFSIHEFSHAYVATKLGDPTPGKQGRLTLNPLVHIDPFGFLLIIIAHFGWAKPVQINPLNFKHPRRDEVFVSIAGPLSNLISAVFFAVVVKLMFVFYHDLFTIEAYGSAIKEMLGYFIWINLILAVFNILPIPPLDGSHILFAVLPDRFQGFREWFSRFGFLILLGLIFSETFTHIDLLPIGNIASVIYQGLLQVLKI